MLGVGPFRLSGVGNIFPALSAFILLWLERIPLPLPGVAAIAPDLFLVAVYYWSVYRPDLLPMLLVFLFGLLDDLLSGAAPGVGPFVYLLCAGGVSWQRRLFQGRNFAALWWGFMLVAAAVILAQWGLTGVLRQAAPVVSTGVFAWLLSIALFPVVTVGLLVLHRTVPRHGQG